MYPFQNKIVICIGDRENIYGRSLFLPTSGKNPAAAGFQLHDVKKKTADVGL